MNLKLLKLGLGTVFLLSLASIGAIVLLVNPYNAGRLNLLFFSVVLLLSLFSLFSWLGFWARGRFVTERNRNHILKMSFRQGLLVAVLLVACLWLSHFKMLKVWTALPIFVLAVGLEYYFLNLENRKWEVEGRE